MRVQPVLPSGFFWLGGGSSRGDSGSRERMNRLGTVTGQPWQGPVLTAPRGVSIRRGPSAASVFPSGSREGHLHPADTMRHHPDLGRAAGLGEGVAGRPNQPGTGPMAPARPLCSVILGSHCPSLSCRDFFVCLSACFTGKLLLVFARIKPCPPHSCLVFSTAFIALQILCNLLTTYLSSLIPAGREPKERELLFCCLRLNPEPGPGLCTQVLRDPRAEQAVHGVEGTSSLRGSRPLAWGQILVYDRGDRGSRSEVCVWQSQLMLGTQPAQAASAGGGHSPL